MNHKVGDDVTNGFSAGTITFTGDTTTATDGEKEVNNETIEITIAL